MRHLRRANVDPDWVISGIVRTIERAEECGEGAWQMQAIRGYELLGNTSECLPTRSKSVWTT